MSDGADRREARRFTMSLPMLFCRRRPKAGSSALKRGMSVTADSISSPTPIFKIGSEIDFVITLPSRLRNRR